jgi:hypothetical protein
MRSLVSLTVVVLFIAGCTAYREVSRGSIEPNASWKIVHGGGERFSRVASALLAENHHIVLTPCNYGKKDVYTVMPLPLPLGSVPGPNLNNGFFIGFQIVAADQHIAFDPQTVLLTLPNGRQFHPAKVLLRFQGCEIVADPDTSNVSKDASQKQTGHNHISGALFFPVMPPAVEEQFSIAVGTVRLGEADVPVPTVFFKKGSAWGGW